jgi:hypothetical protein
MTYKGLYTSLLFELTHKEIQLIKKLKALKTETGILESRDLMNVMQSRQELNRLIKNCKYMLSLMHDKNFDADKEIELYQ